MSNHHNKQEWQVIGKTVRGSSHVRNNLPNQDAMGWWPDSKKGHSLILVVADGHGSSKSFRSDQGSRLAVNSAKQTLQDFLTEISKTDLVQNLASIKQIAELDLPKELIKNWKSEVQKNFSEHPFTDEEWIKLKNQEGIQQREQVEKNPFIAYGTTLLSIVVTDFFILYIQLGDGDILCVDEQGRTERPLRLDKRFLGNQTTSLCLPDAWKEFQVRLVPYPERMPELVLASTDGYSNSFRTEEDFIKIGKDYWEMTYSNNLIELENQLENFLKSASEQGSGDDITLGIIKRLHQNKSNNLCHNQVINQE